MYGNVDNSIYLHIYITRKKQKKYRRGKDCV